MSSQVAVLPIKADSLQLLVGAYRIEFHQPLLESSVSIAVWSSHLACGLIQASSYMVMMHRRSPQNQILVLYKKLST